MFNQIVSNQPRFSWFVSRCGWLFFAGAGALFILAYLLANSMLAALAFVSLCFAVAFTRISNESDVRVGIVIIASVVVYQLLALINSYIFEIPGARPDSITFYDYGVAHARELKFEFGVDYVFYTHILGLLFRAFTPSYFLASQLSVLALVISLVLFTRLSELFTIKPLVRLAGCIVVAFFPGTMAAGVVPLREALELLCLLIAVFSGVQLMTERRFFYFALMLTSAAILGLTHKALLFYSIVICLIFSLGWLVQTRHHNRRRVSIISSIGVAALSAIVASLVYFNDSGYALAYGLVDKNMWWSIWHYRYSIDNLGHPRSAYNIVFNYDTSFLAVKSLLNIYWHYLFYPLVPKTLSLVDIYAAIESWFRLVFIIITLGAFCARKVERRMIYLALFAVFISITFLWSVGTTNYGQAVRHHMLSNWILVLLVSIGLSSPVRKVER